MSIALETVLEACEQLYTPTSSAEFPDRMLATLKPVLPSKFYSWEMLSTADIRSVSARVDDVRGPVDWSHVTEPYRAYAWQHPFAAAALGNGEALVTRSDLLPQRRWERTDFYNLVLSPLGIGDQLTLTLRGETTFACLVFHQEREVSEMLQRTLGLLAPHIRQAMNASFRWDEVEGAGAGAAARVGRVLVSFEGAVEEMEPTALRLLRHHFPTGRVAERTLPPAVRHWFEGAARAMWSASEPAALREGFVATPVGRLRLRLLTQFAARRHVVLIKAEGSLPGGWEGAEGALAALTPREREVLGWIAEGKRNGEIAVILGVAASTVKSQVESILRKLGVETRGAAAAMWRGSQDQA